MLILVGCCCLVCKNTFAFQTWGSGSTYKDYKPVTQNCVPHCWPCALMPKVTEINVGQGRSTLRRIQVELRISVSWNTLRVARRFCNYKQGWLDKIASDRSFNQFLHSETLLLFLVARESEWLQWSQNKAGSLPSETSNRACKKSDLISWPGRREEEKSQCSYLPSQLHLASWNSQFQRDC